MAINIEIITMVRLKCLKHTVEEVFKIFFTCKLNYSPMRFLHEQYFANAMNMNMNNIQPVVSFDQFGKACS